MNSTSEQAPLTLNEFANAVGQRGNSRSAVIWREYLVLVDEQEHVLQVFESRIAAHADLDDRIDRDPAAVSLRLFCVNSAGACFEDWPLHETPLERARSLVSQGHLPRCNAELLRDIRTWHLRGEIGELRMPGEEERRVVRLWWPTPKGEREHVGLLIEREPSSWELMADVRALGLPVEEVDRRIAEAVEELIPNRSIAGPALTAWRASSGAPTSLGLLVYALVDFAVDIADRFHIVRPPDEDLQ